jgi:hypothetical protein
VSQNIQLVEPVVAALRARLEQDLPAEIDAQNAEIQDGYELDYPGEGCVLDFVPPPTQLWSFPTVGIQLGPSRFEDDNAFTATGVYNLTVVCFVQASEQQALARLIMRYARCITRVALRDRTLPPAWGTTLVQVDWGPTMTDTENPRSYLSWFGVTIQAKAEED